MTVSGIWWVFTPLLSLLPDFLVLWRTWWPEVALWFLSCNGPPVVPLKSSRDALPLCPWRHGNQTCCCVIESLSHTHALLLPPLAPNDWNLAAFVSMLSREKPLRVSRPSQALCFCFRNSILWKIYQVRFSLLFTFRSFMIWTFDMCTSASPHVALE